jgi:ADP-heptose:LPS heptosyltransferase
MKTVFFGPFIGEFGWELLFWQGWVRKACQEEFRDYRKIACSFPGRQPFYPYVDEFWPLTPEFLALKASGHGYFTDGWRGGYPGRQEPLETSRKLFGIIPRKPLVQWIEEPLGSADIEPVAEAMLTHFKKQLPEDTKFFVPWKPNQYVPQNLSFGLNLPVGVIPKSGGVKLWQRLEFKDQNLEYLEPSPEGQKLFKQKVQDSRPLISVFPRFRQTRRPDKNWLKDKYSELIQKLQARYPEHTIAILGEPGGAYFVDGVPKGCIDLINVAPERRMDIQVAALKQSVLAFGSMSGAVLVALAAGCPTVIWGYPESKARYHTENFMKTPMIYHSEIDPSTEAIAAYVPELLKEPVLSS